jgi:hypothetical protein
VSHHVLSHTENPVVVVPLHHVPSAEGLAGTLPTHR